MNRTINELKQGLLKCANENENRTYLTGQVIISSICKDAKNYIEELEKEKCELLGIIQKKDELIKKMKCCMVCSHYDFSTPNYCHKGIYRANQIVCDNWELAD